MTLDAARVPPSAAALLPLAERWAIGDDFEREEAVSKLSGEDLDDLAHALDEVGPEFWSWLAGPDSFAADPTPEFLAFSVLAVAVDSAKVKLGRRASMTAQVTVRLQRYVVHCSGLPESDAWAIPPGFDDAMLLVGRDGARVAVKPYEDPVWVEVRSLLEDLGVSDTREQFQRVFPVTIDGFSTYGFQFEGPPRCPGGSRPTAWGPASPPEFDEVQVDLATHERWSGLARDERLALARTRLQPTG